jgi:hypothetical protein
MSKWFVGSSSIKKLALLIMVLVKATLAFSPPLNTLMRLSISSPPNKKQPNNARNSKSVFLVPHS